MAKLFNRAKMTTTTTGSGTITLGSASNGFQSFADAGVADGDVVQYVIEEGANFEIGTGTYSATGTSLTRTPSESSNSDAAITLAGQATVSITAVADDLNRLQHNGTDKVTVSSTGASVTGNLAVSGTVDGVDVSARDAVLTSTTTTANAALPKAGGTMTGGLIVDHNSSPMLKVQATNGSPWALELGRDDQTNSKVYNGGGYWSFEHEPRYYNGGSPQKFFHDGYHPNADKWTSSRTLSLTGGVTGSVSWDGSANASLTSTVALATASAVGGIKIGYTENGKNYPVELSDGKAFVNVPWTDTNTNQLTTFVVQDGDSTNVTMGQGKYLKFAEGGAIDVNFTDTSTGSSGDPYDLTISHADTSSQGNVDTSGSVIIDSVTLDTYGHVTNIGTRSIDQLRIYDNRAAGDVSPDGLPDKTVYFTFTDDLPNTGNTWDSVINMAGWGNGYRAWQLASNSGNGDGNAGLYFRSGEDSSWGTMQRVFADDYHPNADKWTTARTHTVTLTGDVTGTASQSVDGTGNKTWSIATTLGTQGEYAPRKTWTSTLSKGSYTRIARVTGNDLATITRFSFAGTTGGVVVGAIADIIVNHSADIHIQTQSGDYTQLTLKVHSNSSNEDYDLYAKYTTGSGTSLSLRVEAFSLNDETITANPTATAYSGGTELEHAMLRGTKSSQSSSNADIWTDGNVTAANMLINQYLYHSGDLDTYLDFNTANSWRVVTGGTEGLKVSGNNVDIPDAIRHTGDTDTYMQFGTNQWNVYVGGSREITVDTTGVRLGDTGNGYFQPVSGSYGSIQIDGGDHGGYEGYSIGGRAVFMHDNGSVTGIFNDVDNEWLMRGAHNAEVRLYHNGVERVRTTSSGIEVNNGQNSSYITMADANEGARNIHCNSNRLGFLDSSSNWSFYSNDDGDVEAVKSLDVGTGNSGYLKVRGHPVNMSYGQGGADSVLFDYTHYSDNGYINTGADSESNTTGSSSDWVYDTNHPFAGGRALKTSAYKSFYSDYIPVIPGEQLYGEIWTKYHSGSGGTLYYGIERYDSQKRPISSNNGTSYFVASNVNITSTTWQKNSGYTTIPRTHTAYSGSDGGGVYYVRIRVLFNYSSGGALRSFGGILLKRTHSQAQILSLGTPGGDSFGAGTRNGRWLSLEGDTDSSGEGSGRIFFTEHNDTTASMDKYGFSIGYRGGATSITGASGNAWTGLSQIGNGEWGMWGHNNDATGALIMHGDRAGTYVDFSGNNIQGANNITASGTTTSYRFDSTYNSGTEAPRWDTSFYVVQSQHWYGQTSSQLMYLGESGNTTQVRGTLDVASQIRHIGDTNTYMQFHAADQWRVVVGGTERLEVKNSSPHVLVTGDLNSTSDARLKENVEPIANALSDITQLEGVSFDWKDTGTRGHGFIAQQVEPILPDVVQTDDETGIKSINYVGMIGHLVEAIKEQQTQIDALTAQVEELKRQ